MKTILPCPKCNQFFLPPASIAPGATLKCPGCGYHLAAESLFVDIDSTAACWGVADSNSTENVVTDVIDGGLVESIQDNFDGVVAEDTFSAIDEDHGFATSAIVFEEALSPDWKTEESNGAPLAEVPPSNEWETQPSSLDGQETSSDSTRASNESDLDGNQLAANELAINEFEFTPLSLEEEPSVDEVASTAESSRLESATLESNEWADESADDALILDDGSLVGESIVSEASTADEMDIMFQEDSLVKGADSEDAPLTLAPLPSAPTAGSTKRLSDPFGALGKAPKKRPQESPLKMIGSVVGGGVAAVPIAILLMWYVLGKDPLKAGPAVAQFVPWIVPAEFSDESGMRSRIARSDARLNGRIPTLPSVQMESNREVASSVDAESGAMEPQATNSKSTEPNATEPRVSEPVAAEPVMPEPAVAEVTLEKMVEPRLANAVAGPSETATGMPSENVAPKASDPVSSPVKASQSQAEMTVSNVPAQSDIPKEPKAAKLKGSAIRSELWDSIEQSNPAESIATLKAYLASDSKAKGHDLKVKQALTAVASDLAKLHFENSPSFKTWQQAAAKVVAPMVKDRAFLAALIAANTPSASGGQPNEGGESSGNGSGFNIILLDTAVELDGATQWLPHPRSKKFWTGTRVLVPKSIMVPGQSGGQYMLLGTSRPSQEGGEEYKLDFTVLLALPL